MFKMRKVLACLMMFALLVTGVAFAEAKTEITILTRWSGSDPMADYLDNYILEFEERHPDVKVNNISINEEASYNNKFKTLVATGDIPNVFYLPGIASLVKYAENGLIMDVSVLFEDGEWYNGFLDGAFDMFDFATYGVEGVYAVPFAATPEGVFYNADMLKEVGYEAFPETMEEFYVCMDKLLEKGYVPFAPGAAETWRVGHLHNQLLYKWCGTSKATELGARTAKWTDEDVVQSLAWLKDMNDRGYLMENCAGLTLDMEKTMFFTQQSAMTCNGSWFIGDITAQGELGFDVAFAAWPYFTEREENKGAVVQYPQNWCLKGGMEGAEYDATVAFVKEYTGRDNQTRVTAEKGTLPIRKDIDYSGIELNDLFMGCMDVLNNATSQAGDSFDYDQLSSMQDVTRNNIVGMLLGNTPEECAKAIQDEIDTNG
ncbi:MAG: extracellular solute-binding protein [Clostridiales bacterium]|nr:extracellular solute-binding protein [Clostridiales bacterium]